MSPRLDAEFLASLAETGKAAGSRFPWYRGAIIGLGALNYPEEIPPLYTHLLEHYIPEKDKKLETRKILEGLTKASGIVGAAKTGNAVRPLSLVIPEHLKDDTCYRRNETFEEAAKRGRTLHTKIYSRNPTFDDKKTLRAAPDYYWIVTNLFYGYIFSFDDILDDLETGHCIISALLGIDCQEQVRNHMIGMQLNGVERKEIEAFRNVVLRLAEKLGVQFKSEPIPVPDVPAGAKI
ncbi:hypothetical protein BU26DRAFT_566561 [Trematosphaeria pertusa]|uniref:Uncharacterized protein n=1 Tax=Trematosphaeria pertusa TaxID=390896 RepID=A0A6A6IB42_9PLEO|nr:uncharacterized protein BU26DRAFT_566561 [Trematosphaeria pertusa]KAF2247611.1 hypothetical protein BU26DRAFT_566561 [Trematosphaeria pertusa]